MVVAVSTDNESPNLQQAQRKKLINDLLTSENLTKIDTSGFCCGDSLSWLISKDDPNSKFDHISKLVATITVERLKDLREKHEQYLSNKKPDNKKESEEYLNIIAYFSQIHFLQHLTDGAIKIKGFVQADFAALLNIIEGKDSKYKDSDFRFATAINSVDDIKNILDEIADAAKSDKKFMIRMPGHYMAMHYKHDEGKWYFYDPNSPIGDFCFSKDNYSNLDVYFKNLVFPMFYETLLNRSYKNQFGLCFTCISKEGDAQDDFPDKDKIHKKITEKEENKTLIFKQATDQYINWYEDKKDLPTFINAVIDIASILLVIPFLVQLWQQSKIESINKNKYKVLWSKIQNIKRSENSETLEKNSRCFVSSGISDKLSQSPEPGIAEKIQSNPQKAELENKLKIPLIHPYIFITIN